MTLVRYAEVHLGRDGDFPSVQQLVGLLKEACLDEIKIIVTLWSEATRHHQEASGQQQQQQQQQQQARRQQWLPQSRQQQHDEQVLQNPEDTVEAGVDFDIDIEDQPHLEPSRFMLQTVCPPGLRELLEGLFSGLAAGVPALTELVLRGCCWDAALPAFGGHCMRIVSLDVQADNVPVQTLEGLGQILPSLADVTIRCNTCDSDHEQQLGLYMDALLPQLQRCTHLHTLRIGFTDDITLTCQPDCWRLPAGLQHLGLGCFVESSDPLQQLLHRVPSLCLQDSPCEELLEVFQQFPLLVALEVLSSNRTVWLHCSEGGASHAKNDHPTAWLPLLQHRFLTERFALTCMDLGLVGTCKQVRDTLAWLPDIPSVIRLFVDFEGGRESYVHCLTEVPRRFPEARDVELSGEPTWPSLPGMGVAFLQPLEACPDLARLRLLCPALPLTTHGLARLCEAFQSPELLHFVLREGVDREALEAAILELERNITVVC
ncbi:MAG: hypothetical protein WDW38_004527 [Sanguina aurantia]